MSNDCPYHADHENRIKRLEKDMEEVDKHIKSSYILELEMELTGA